MKQVSILLFLCLSRLSYAQEAIIDTTTIRVIEIDEPIEMGVSHIVDVWKYNIWEVLIHANRVSSICEESISGFSFEVDSAGVVKDLYFLPNFPPILKIVLEESLRPSWVHCYFYINQIMQGFLIANKPTFVPVIYYFNTPNCEGKTYFFEQGNKVLSSFLNKNQGINILEPLILDSKTSNTLLHQRDKRRY